MNFHALNFHGCSINQEFKNYERQIFGCVVYRAMRKTSITFYFNGLKHTVSITCLFFYNEEPHC